MITPRHALFLFVPLRLAFSCLALPRPAGAAAFPSPPTAAAAIDEATARKEKSEPEAAAKDDSKEKEGDKKDDKDQTKEPPFDKVVKGARLIKGLFNVYVKDDDAKFYFEIAPDQLDAPFLLNPTLVSGLGQGFLYPSDMLPEYVVAFHKNGKTIQLIHRNVLFRADESSTMHRPAALAAPDAIAAQAKIESQPHPDRKSFLVDLASIFLGDLEGMSLALKQVLEAPYQFDREGSALAFAKGFPDNVDLETVLHFKTPEIKKRAVYAADPRSLLIRFHYAISRLPQTGYRPRLADDRVGHFLAMVDDYSDDREDQPTVRYITRWQLEKKDPSAALSGPKQPIDFYLENTIPKSTATRSATAY